REYGGAERVLEVLSEIFPRAPIFTSYYAYEKFTDTLLKTKDIRTTFVQHLPFLWRPNSFVKRGRRRLAELMARWVYLLPAAFQTLNLRSYDLVISNSAYCANRISLSDRQLHVCYCLTPPRFIWEDRPTPKSGDIRGSL